VTNITDPPQANHKYSIFNFQSSIPALPGWAFGLVGKNILAQTAPDKFLITVLTPKTLKEKHKILKIPNCKKVADRNLRVARDRCGCPPKLRSAFLLALTNLHPGIKSRPSSKISGKNFTAPARVPARICLTCI